MADLGALDVTFGNAIRAITPYGITYPIYNQRLAGITTINGVPNTMRVLVVDNSGRLLGYTDSANDGTWELTGLSQHLDGVDLTVISIDLTGTYNAEAISNVLMVL